MRDVFIVDGARTAVGVFGGSLKDIPAANLGAIVIKETLKKVGLRPVIDDFLREVSPDALKEDGMVELEKKHYDYDSSLKEVVLDEVIMGNVVQAGQGQNPARQAMIYAGIPKEVPAFTVNKVCASGMKAISLGALKIAAGEADILIVGGMENMSRIPYALPNMRWGARMFNSDCVDLMVYDGLWELFYGYHMGITAENIVQKYNISREEQDKIGLLSHQRAREAIKTNRLKDEIVPVIIPQKKGEPIVFDADERPMDTSLEKMAKLRPAFKPDGTVTAGNASGINDAAAALLIASEEKIKELGLNPMARIVSYASGATDPAYMGLGPIPATRKALKIAGLKIEDMDLIELNEAFAAQFIACARELNISLDNTNVNGSGISIGHPIGCTGARIVLALAYELKRRGLKKGLATLCIGGGMGMAMIIEMV